MNLKLTVRESVKDSELIESFMKDVNRYKPIDKEKEVELFKTIELGKEAEKEIKTLPEDDKSRPELQLLIDKACDARNIIISCNQKLVYAIAKRLDQGELVMDLISEGNLGMMEAINSFDCSRGTRFTTYASSYVIRNMHNFIENKSRLIQRPNNIISTKKVARFEDKFLQENYRMPTQEETFEAMKKLGEYFPKQEDMYGIFFDSIEETRDRGDDDDELETQPIEYINIASVENDYVEKSKKDDYNVILDSLMSCLSDKEKRVIKLSFGFETGGEELTNKEVGDIIGISSERARQIRLSALKKVKDAIQVSKK